MKRRRGFTLFELLVAMCITTMIATLLFRIFFGSTKLWTRNEERLETFREARCALQLMSRDLSRTITAPDLTRPVPFFALEPHPDTAKEDRLNHELAVITRLENRGKSDLCAVNYFCVWNNKHHCFSLQRQFTESDATFVHLHSALNSINPLSFEDAFRILYPRDTSLSQTVEVASPIWDLRFRTPNPEADSEKHSVPNALPAWVEIRFCTMDRRALESLSNEPMTRRTWFDPSSEFYARRIRPHEEQFVLRVKLPQ